MKSTDPQFIPGVTDKNWFKKGHKLSPESLEKMKKAKKKYTAEELIARQKARSQDPHRITWMRNYKKTPKRKFQIYKNSAEFKHIVFQLSYEDFLSFWQANCSYCGLPIETIGLDRVDNHLGYIRSNLVSCCKTCNYMKRELSIADFLEQCRRIVSLLP